MKNCTFLSLLFVAFLTSVGGPLSAQENCDCKDYVILNDPPTNEVHKFEVLADGSGLREIGSPWLAPTSPGDANNIGAEPLSQPHGVHTDVNGFVYIGDVDDFGNNGGIVKLTCEGEVLEDRIDGPTIWGYNTGSVGNLIFIPRPGFNANNIQVWDVCENTLVRTITPVTAIGWGFTISQDEQFYYYTTGWFDGGNNRIVRGTVDGSGPEQVVYDSGNNTGAFMGVAQDSDGNFYVVYNLREDGQGSAQTLKISPAGTVIAMTPVDNTRDRDPGVTSGWFGARGVAYSPLTDKVFVGSFEDCLSVFDNNLNYLESESIGYVEGSEPKGVGLVTECCPNAAIANVTLDTVICTVAPEPVFLQDLINCDGAICGGQWEPGLDNSANIAYNPCNNELTFTGDGGCGTFRLASDGGGPNAICEPFDITVSVCFSLPPEVVLTTDCTSSADDASSTFSLAAAVTSTEGLAGREVVLTVGGTVVATETLDANGAFNFDVDPLNVPAGNDIPYSFAIAGSSACSQEGTLDLEPCPRFDLSLDKEVDAVATPGPYFPGADVAYTITVTNEGFVDAFRVNVLDFEPDGTTIVSGSSTTAGVSFADGNFIIPTLAVGASVDLTIRLRIDTDFTGTSLENAVRIRSADNDMDPTTKPRDDEDSNPYSGNRPGADGILEDDAQDAVSITVQPCPTPNCGGAPTGAVNGN